MSAPLKSDKKSLRKSKCRSSSSSSSSSDSDRSRRHHRRHRRSHSRSPKKVCEVKEGFFKECANLWCPEGNLGPVHEYHLDDHNYKIPVAGFLKGQDCAPDTPIDLFAKKSCNNKGLGLAQTPENGVNQNVYLQFDICELLADDTVVAFELCFDLLDCKDVIEVYGSNTPGQLGHKLLKTDGEQRKIQVCLEEHQHKFISVSLHRKRCSDKLGFLVKCMCMYHRKPPAYAFTYSTTIQQVALGAPIPFDNISFARGFRQIDVYTLECLVRGVYGEIKTIDTLEPNSCALYVNGVKVPGAWFGANATAQDIGQALVKLNVGDRLQLINESSQGGTVTLSPLGSGANNSVGQSVAAFSIWRVD